MTMQTTSLPFQVSGANGATSPNGQARDMRGSAVLGEGADFGATLTRQLQQRQLEQRQALAPPPRAPQAQPAAQPQSAAKPQAPAKPAANEAQAPAREAAKEPAKDGAQADKADAAQETAGASTAAEGKDEADATPADAKGGDAATDMLAMLASLGQPAQAAAPAVAEDTAAGGGALQAALKGKPGADDGKAAVKPAADALGAVTDQPQDKAAPGVDLRALDLARAGEQAGKAQPDAGQFSAKLQDSMAHAATLKDSAPAAVTGLAAQATALQTAQAAGAVPTDRLSARVGTPAWDNQVGQKVIWMVGGEEQSATLELNPPDLGPVQVVLNVSNEMASVTFSAQQLEVRQALENSLPRLREMMNESGIALGNATVNAGSDGSQQQNQQGSSRPGSGGGNGGGDSAVAETAPRQRTSILGGAGAVDTFA
ncbi:flagellar hook-length control protein FliK [Massilia sp.]|uniref:flagellar hook-length control protein FliK n=1 Tax=Massilia sp. TaxID=1882437 RepID=UPI0028A8D5AA|nr:flagellar hook-length control protein FliK [Massilia sp.]